MEEPALKKRASAENQARFTSYVRGRWAFVHDTLTDNTVTQYGGDEGGIQRAKNVASYLNLIETKVIQPTPLDQVLEDLEPATP